MARQESDKEDLIRDATALVERAELVFCHNRKAGQGFCLPGELPPEETPDGARAATPSHSNAAAHDSTNIITIGRYRDGRAVFYFDQDPFYQFDVNGRLRRAFEGGRLFRSQGTTLAAMTRRRTHLNGPDDSGPAPNVVLERADLDATSLRAFRDRMQRRLSGLLGAINSGQATIRRAVTDDGGLPSGTVEILTRVLSHGPNFLSDPPAGR